MNTISFPDLPVVLVDDEQIALQSMDIVLRSAGINNIKCIQDSRDVMGFLERVEVGIVMLDLTMPYLSGEDLLLKIVCKYPEIPVIIVTGKNEIEKAIKCIQLGAFGYYVKPIDDNQLITAVKKAVQFRELQKENSILSARIKSTKLESPESFHEIVTNNEKMNAIFRYVEAIAETSKPVLIIGETGVGKELIARSIHNLSRRKGLFVTINASSLSDELFADTLFGHVKGSYTGATGERKGLIERASGGTLFLDEIGDLSLDSQVKLLRLLQEREYHPVGSDLPKRSDARIIVATNRNLVEMQKDGKFRTDLYYRLKTHHIYIPPLRERIEDLPLLLDHFLEKAANELEKKKPTPPKELLTLLSCYHFPGNIRELEGMVYDSVSSHKTKKLSMTSFKNAIGEKSIPDSKCNLNPIISLSGQFPTIKEATDFLIEEALRRSNNNQTIAAGLLGITRQALNKRLHKKNKEKKQGYFD